METWTVDSSDGGRLLLHSFTRPGTVPIRPGAHRGTPAEASSGRTEGPTTAGPPPRESTGVVLVHGTLVTDKLYRPFAHNLGTLLGRPVHCYNRRGRAGSSGQPDGYSVQTEIEDLAAVMEATGSTDVVGHSYGGFVALQAALTLPIRRLVTYDAAVSLAGSLNHRWRPELEVAVTAGQLDHAWAHLVQGLGTAGPVSYLPMGALRMLSIVSARTRLGAEMRQLLPTAVTEMRAVLDADAEADDFTSLTTPTLMLTGGWSPGYFAETGRQLASIAPAVEFAVVPGQLHEGPLRPGKRLAMRMARFLNA
ncbi:alpha/beta hydrolase [Pseudarthrobacter sp. J75]|uniref:alpha/beta fold hydrolase n=1 Tax=unclassified Pseudarthrobacter TaxID=2647000 RepID=UPI002E7FF5D0|nr:MULTISPECIES: alpha/beta hydrolase [unclassified Pseudarthrobacter]MEE2522000.1 alpha/beta hydrolase [Pseudarthrobacter sp. J47]MEE2528925.1 alpha/beta hydrolase [Pseudarthrobacter sp. J75]MEE2570280.1 alpha/beta hydrolase [Pseudarthrobacter sp. J64]